MISVQKKVLPEFEKKKRLEVFLTQQEANFFLFTPAALISKSPPVSDTQYTAAGNVSI